MEFNLVQELVQQVKDQIHTIVKGNHESIDLLLIALLCRGHVLLEGVPGTAKTLLARVLAALLSVDFKRIQFTPDLMPGDIIGTNLFNFHTNQFTLTKGPVFTDILLADEINRTPPKTQAALLEAMQERAVTIDGKSYALGEDFLVIATQNPIEQQGTYPLPEAQLDRFLFKIPIEYPSLEEERDLVRIHGHRTIMPALEEFNIRPIMQRTFIHQIRQIIAKIYLADDLIDYIVRLVQATREHTGLLCGASPRSSTVLAVAVRSYAVLQGRDFVIPDDVKKLLFPTLLHRLPLSPGAEIEGISVKTILNQIIDKVPAPR